MNTWKVSWQVYSFVFQTYFGFSRPVEAATAEEAIKIAVGNNALAEHVTVQPE